MDAGACPKQKKEAGLYVNGQSRIYVSVIFLTSLLICCLGLFYLKTASRLTSFLKQPTSQI